MCVLMAGSKLLNLTYQCRAIQERCNQSYLWTLQCIIFIDLYCGKVDSSLWSFIHNFSLKSVNFDPSVSLYSFKASWRKFRRKRLHCTRRPWRYSQLSVSQLPNKSHVKHFSHRRETYLMAHCAQTSLVVAANSTQHFLFWVEHCSFCVFCFCFWQSKKNYELRCREADEAEQGAEKASVTTKNPDKVQ